MTCIVALTSPPTLRCTKCDETAPLSLPMTVDQVVAVTQAFQKRHANCAFGKLAPLGKYQCVCASCKRTFDSFDKHCVCCANCAVTNSEPAVKEGSSATSEGFRLVKEPSPPVGHSPKGTP